MTDDVERGLRANVHRLAVEHGAEKLRADCAEKRVADLEDFFAELYTRSGEACPDERYGIVEEIAERAFADSPDGVPPWPKVRR